MKGHEFGDSSARTRIVADIEFQSPGFSTTLLDVPLASAALGLSRNKAYEAAARGEIPTLRFGIVVPTAPLRRMLGLESGSPTEQPTEKTL
jgi:hypothetical protein